MLVFLFVLLIILSSIILLLALTSIQIQINNLIIKNNKKEDGEVKIVLKLLKIIPYFEIDVLNSKFIKKEITLKKHPRLKNKISLKKLIEMLYERNDIDLKRGTFRVRGDSLEIVPAYERTSINNTINYICTKPTNRRGRKI